MENQSLLPITSNKYEKKTSIVRRVVPFALVLVVISIGFVVTYHTTGSKSTLATADTTLLKSETKSDSKSDSKLETKLSKSSKTGQINTNPDQWWTYNPTPANDHPTKKPTEEKRKRNLHQDTHKPTHNKNKPTHEPTRGNPTITSHPTPKDFVDDETMNPTPKNDHPTKKPSKDAVLKKQMHRSLKSQRERELKKEKEDETVAAPTRTPTSHIKTTSSPTTHSVTTSAPTKAKTTSSPTVKPTVKPTFLPPTAEPSFRPTPVRTEEPTDAPTFGPGHSAKPTSEARKHNKESKNSHNRELKTGGETYNPTPANDHPTKKPSDESMRDIFIAPRKRVLHKEDAPRVPAY